MSGMLNNLTGRASFEVKRAMRDSLTRRDKVATRQTYASVNAVSTATPSGSLSVLGSAGEGWRFVEAGKRAGTKLPMVKTADGWRLVDRLAAWKKARALTMPDFLLARKIAVNPRAPVELSRPALHDAANALTPRIFDAMVSYVASSLSMVVAKNTP
jgi:hypothetical protein